MDGERRAAPAHVALPAAAGTAHAAGARDGAGRRGAARRRARAPRHRARPARALAGAFSGLAESAIVDVTSITAFGDEYGFVNELLPVYHVRYATLGHDRYYVHLDSATLAAHVDDFDYIEGWTFANLHKWQWLESLVGRDLRDSIQIAFALLAATVAALGLRLFIRRH